MRLVQLLKVTLASLALLSTLGCSLVTGVFQHFMTPAEMEYRYGFTVMSRPLHTTLGDVEKAISLEEQKLSFDTALQEAAQFQSAAYRRYQVRQQLGLQASADVLKAQQLSQALAANAAPPAGSTDAPPLPTVTKLTADPEFMKTGPLPDLATPYRGRIQTAFNNVLMSRLGASQLSILKKMEDQWDMHLVYSTLTVNPGLLTRNNSAAEIRTRWSMTYGNQAAPSSDIQVIPIFPTYDSVGEVNDAASMNERLLFLAALVKYGPAQGQAEYQRLVNDVKRLASANERVTLIGSPLPDNTIQYRIRGVRVADPLNERRPSGKTAMEPLTLPTVTLVMVSKNAYKAHYGDMFNVSMEYSGCWRRDRPVWDNIPPGNLIYGFWYDRGTRYKWPIPEDQIKDKARKPSNAPWQLPDRWFETQDFVRISQPALRYQDVFQIESKEPKNPQPVIFEAQATPIEITHPFTQVLLVRATGDQPKEFYVDNIKVDGQKLSDPVINPEKIDGPQKLAASDKAPYHTYAILLKDETLRNLAKARGIQPLDEVSAKSSANPSSPPVVNAIAMLTAVNGAGASQIYQSPDPTDPTQAQVKMVGGIPLHLNYNFAYPVNPPPESISANGKWKGEDFNVELIRRNGHLWPAEMLNLLGQD